MRKFFKKKIQVLREIARNIIFIFHFQAYCVQFYKGVTTIPHCEKEYFIEKETCQQLSRVSFLCKNILFLHCLMILRC